MNYPEISTELKYYYAPPLQAKLGLIESSFFTTEKENIVFNIHENNIYSISNMKTGELWTNIKLRVLDDGTLSI